MIGRFAEAFQNDDIDGVVALLTDDVLVSMPPEPEWHQGRAAVAAFLRERAGTRVGGIRLLETRANAQPALAYYLEDEDGWHRVGVFVISLRDDQIAAVTRFHDDGLLSQFGVPARLPYTVAVGVQARAGFVNGRRVVDTYSGERTRTSRRHRRCGT